jgi:asparagine synthase (glutamine-hydrolysing)
VKGTLPADILTRKKMGFPVPFGIWMRGAGADLARDVLLDSRARQRGITDAAAVSSLIDDHAAGRSDGTDAIWSLLNLELWYRTVIDGEGVQTLPIPGPAAPAGDPRLLRATA